MTVQSRLRVERALISLYKLVNGIVVDSCNLFLKSRFLLGRLCRFGTNSDRGGQRAIGQAHEYAVEPHLIGIDGLMPIHLVGHRARLVLQLLHQRLHGLQVLLLGQLLIHACDKVARADVVEVVVLHLESANLALPVDHRVGVELAVVHDFLVAVAQISVEHAFELNAHHVAPLRAVREVEHVALRLTLHFAVGHPLRVVLVGLLNECQTAVDEEILEAHVARLTAHEVAFAHAVEVAVLHVDVIDVSIFLQPDDLYAVLRLLAGDVLNVHVAHDGVEATAADFVVLIVEVDFQHSLLAHAHLDVAGVDVLDDATTARVGLDAHHALQFGRVHHAVMCKHVLATA